MDSVAQIVADCGSHSEPNSMSHTARVEARIHKEAEEIEVWSPSYPRSLQTVWIGDKEQSVAKIQIHYSKSIAEILSSTHRAPWTLARMWTIQGHATFENAQGRNGRHCPPLPQSMSITNKGVLKVTRSSEVGRAIAILRRLQAIDV